ncbi:SWIM zinc finger family protein [Sphingobacterium thalpophilum]|uniref:SWIM zinc finger family protein n=1 Tax=Sphingobacterium thalpophilum TaxID=259 RepID=UPI003C738DDB
MKILQILAKQSETKVTQAKKLAFRELEEFDHKGNFVAYVDEGAESYDVNIQLDKDIIVGHSCDCGRRETYCIHQIAILIELSAKKKESSNSNKVSKSSQRKKVKESEQLLLSVEQESLTAWLLELFKTNKDIELQFLLKFGKDKQEYQEKDVVKILRDAVASVIGKRRKVEASEVKKIVQLWEKSLIPFWDYLALNIGNEKVIDLFSAVYNGVTSIEYQILYTGTRFKKFIEISNTKIAMFVAQIESDIQWVKLTDAYWSKMWTLGNEQGGMLDLLVLMYQSSSPDRKRLLSVKIEHLLKENLREGYHMSLPVDEFFLDVLIENDTFEANMDYFFPRHWEARYNLKLIEAVKPLDPERAIAYCNLVIESNARSEYNDPFLDILEELYTLSGDLNKLAQIKMYKFGVYPNFADYKFIVENSEDEQLNKKFRTNTLTMLRNGMSYDYAAGQLYFDILKREENYSKMLEAIDYRVGAKLLLHVWNDLYAYDKLRFLRAIANSLHIDYRTDPSDLEQLIHKIMENYERDVIKILFKPSPGSNYLRSFRAMVYNELEDR